MVDVLTLLGGADMRARCQELAENSQRVTAQNAEMQQQLIDTEDDLGALLGGIDPEDWPTMKTVSCPADAIAQREASRAEYFMEQEALRHTTDEAATTMLAMVGNSDGAIGWAQVTASDVDGAPEHLVPCSHC